jgi:WD40 repeat protein
MTGNHTMHRRLFVLVISVVFLIVSCAPVATEQVMPTAVAIPLATETFVPTTQPPSIESVTPTEASQVALPMDWLSQLEVIQAGNWSRLQLLKTFPAEMPLNHSAVAISPDGKTMAVGSSEGAQIFFFDIASGQLSRTISIGISNVGAYFNIVGMEYLPDGTIMANSTGPYAIYHIDGAGNVLSMWDGTGFALSADKRTIAHGTVDGVALVDIASNTLLGSFEGNYALDFSFSPDGSKIALNDVGVDYVTTTIWDVASKTQLTTLNEMGNVRYSPNGKFLAVTSYAENQNPLKIFSPDGVTQLATLSVNEPNSLTGEAPLFSHDGSIIAAQVGNGSPLAWDTTNWQIIDSSALQGELYSFSPDGRILVTRASDGSILLWGVLP